MEKKKLHYNGWGSGSLSYKKIKSHVNVQNRKKSKGKTKTRQRGTYARIHKVPGVGHLWQLQYIKVELGIDFFPWNALKVRIEVEVYTKQTK